ncbi:hypothetical protein [Nocardioides sp. LHG3406-4]|uniref:hypothetical protein n=1 Tax=Nocardioides sp. LHG3406-4 TaxID=2804575 RepID=UPI003CF639D4
MTSANQPASRAGEPTGESAHAAASGRPTSVTLVVRVLLALVAVTGLAAVLVWVRQDKVIRTWAEGNVAARKLLAEGGLEAVKDSPIAPSFVPLAIVFFVVFALLVLVLVAFFVEGHEWARLSLAATALFGVLAAAVVVRLGLPVLFTVVAVVAIVLCLFLLLLLWHKDTNRYFRQH